MSKKSTIFCNIDGVIFKRKNDKNLKDSKPEVLPKVRDKIKKWREDGHMVILTSARPVSLYTRTILELTTQAIEFDKIILGIENGSQVLISNLEIGEESQKALSINLKRNEGFENINWDDYGL